MEWSPAITLSGSDVAGAFLTYYNNESNSFDVEFKINGSWVTAQTNAQDVIGSTQEQGALIALQTTGSWTGVRVTGGSNISVSGVTAVFTKTVLSCTTELPTAYLDFSDNSSNAALGYDAAGSNNWTVNNFAANAPGLSTANQGFNVVTYSGNGSNGRAINLGFSQIFYGSNVVMATSIMDYGIASVEVKTSLFQP